jgi:RNA polymerase sigma-70 factor (ECF subfamily)
MTDRHDRLYESLLVLRWQAGDEPAFVELVERYHARLRLFLRQMLRDEHAAEDALQDVWLDAFRGLGKLRDTAAFAGWLYRIARDRAYRVLRKRGGLRLVSLNDEDHSAVIPPTAAADDSGVEPDEPMLVNASLERLPHEQREVLLLRFIEGMSYVQIAAAVGCEVGTVRSRLYYGKRALKREFEGTRER